MNKDQNKDGRFTARLRSMDDRRIEEYPGLEHPSARERRLKGGSSQL